MLDKLGLEVRTGHLFLFANAGRNKLSKSRIRSQLREKLPQALLEKLSGSLSLVQDRLRFAEYKVCVLEERLRPAQIEKYGPGSEKLSDDQLELLELEPGVSSAEVRSRKSAPAIGTAT